MGNRFPAAIARVLHRNPAAAIVLPAFSNRCDNSALSVLGIVLIISVKRKASPELLLNTMDDDGDNQMGALIQTACLMSSAAAELFKCSWKSML